MPNLVACMHVVLPASSNLPRLRTYVPAVDLLQQKC